ncbi:hypothetical protein [Agrobacterium tumefaciens]|uniref:hypothetical protein n=1 Tax=Agrobacterium tumefaciens TaxID=358 RepID=UPI0021D1393C|nr:hypothetical protein [Agrobacterium tumefaciens]
MELGRDDRRTGLAVTYDLTKATLTVAWVIILNKPFYPLYVWYLVDADAAVASLVTVLSLPFFLRFRFLQRNHIWLRAWRFLLWERSIPCLKRRCSAMHPAPNFSLQPASCWRPSRSVRTRNSGNMRWQFFCSRTFLGAGVQSWSAGDLATLLNLNAFSAASLMAFIALRYAGLSRRTET